MIYELEYDLQKFGDILLKIRKHRKVTQKKIRELTGIHPDTIKGLEYGLRFPTLDTLNKLNEIYKLDLLKVLSECKYENDIYVKKLYKKIDTLSYSDNVSEINDFIQKINDYKLNYSGRLSNMVLIMLEQLTIFSFMLKIKNKSDIMNVLETERLCYKAIRINHNSFDEIKLEQNYYSVLESRILLILGISKSRQEKYDAATRITEFASKQLFYHYLSDKSLLHLVLQSYFNLSYHNFISENHEEVLRICNQGIDLAKDEYSTRFLPHFYFRKGISEYQLKRSDYIASLVKSFQYLYMDNNHTLIEKYKSTLKSNYGIILDDIEIKQKS